MTVNQDCILKAGSGVVAAFVGTEAVLWSERDGTYYGLDEVGARVWRLSGDGKSLGAVHRALLEEYDVDGARLWSDLERLSCELMSLGLAVTGAVPGAETSERG